MEIFYPFIGFSCPFIVAAVVLYRHRERKPIKAEPQFDDDAADEVPEEPLTWLPYRG